MKKIILVLSVLFSSHLMAYQVAQAKINAVNTNPGSALVELAGTITNDDSCSNPASSNTLILAVTDQTKTLYSALLSAKVSGVEARVLYEGCLAGLPSIIRVDLL